MRQQGLGEVGWGWRSRNFSPLASRTRLAYSTRFSGKRSNKKWWERRCLPGIIVSVVLFATVLWSLTLRFFWEGKTGDTFDSDRWKGTVLASSLACSGVCATLPGRRRQEHSDSLHPPVRPCPDLLHQPKSKDRTCKPKQSHSSLSPH